MNTNFGDIEKSLNVETSIVKKDESKPELPNVVLKKNDVEKDYKYTRGQLYSLIEKGQEAINGIMEVAGESASPRAYEVAGQLIKSVADSTDKLMDLQKKMKDIDEDSTKTQNNVTNNALFVGSTSELSKLLKQGSRVLVPFGKRTLVGVVWSFSERDKSSNRKYKYIKEILDEVPLLDSNSINLAEWSSRYYHYPLGEIISYFFPPSLRKGKEARFRESKYLALTSKGSFLEE